MADEKFEPHFIHPLIVRSVRYGGGKRYWLEEKDTASPVAHMGTGHGSKYAYLFAAAPVLLTACEAVLMKFKLDPATRALMEEAVRLTMPLP